MRRYIGIAVAILAAVVSMNTASAQDTLVVSERVGKVIDKYERDYFNLFPTVRDYSNGALIAQDSGSVALSVNGQFVLFLNADMMRLLEQYVREYDAVRWGLRNELSESNVNNHFSLLVKAGIVLPFIPCTGRIVTVRIRPEGAASESSITGELMWADERLVLVRPGDGSLNVDPVSIAAADIASISLFKSAPTTGTYIGIGIGGTAAVLATIAAVTSDNGRQSLDPTNSTLIVLTMGAIGAAVFGLIGALIGHMSETEYRREIEIPYDYLIMLPELRRVMYYRYGLPPDSPWREK